MSNRELSERYRAHLGAQRQIAKLEPQPAGCRAKLAEVEAKIIELDGLL